MHPDPGHKNRPARERAAPMMMVMMPMIVERVHPEYIPMEMALKNIYGKRLDWRERERDWERKSH